MLRLEVVAVYAGVNLLILLVLGYLVAIRRRRHKIAFGDGGDNVFNRAVRAHANAAEYIPAGLVGLVLLAQLEPGAPLWLLHASGISLTAGRILHALGLYAAPVNLGRVLGIILTWAAYLLMAGGLIYVGLTHGMGN